MSFAPQNVDWKGTPDREIKLFCMTPFREDKNLGEAYNEAMRLLPDDGWACFLDHDAWWTTPQWNTQIRAAIKAEPSGTFTAVTNNIASRWQRTDANDLGSTDILHHKRIGVALAKKDTLLDVTTTAGFGGVVIVISKPNWYDVGGFVNGMFCVDHQMHYALRDAGRRIYLIEGLYVYHARGSSGDRNFKAPVALDRKTGKECHCRRHPEPIPTERRQI